MSGSRILDFGIPRWLMCVAGNSFFIMVAGFHVKKDVIAGAMLRVKKTGGMRLLIYYVALPRNSNSNVAAWVSLTA